MTAWSGERQSKDALSVHASSLSAETDPQATVGRGEGVTPTRVTLLTSRLTVGGAERVFAALARGFDPVRIVFSIVCLHELGAVGRELARDGINVRCVSLQSRTDLIGWWRLLRGLQQLRPDVLLSTDQPLSLLACRAARTLRLGGAHVVASHITDPADRRLRRRMTRTLVVAHADRIIALGETHRAFLVNDLRIPKRRIVVVPNGVKQTPTPGPQERARAQAFLEVPSSSPVVGVVAMLRPEKDHETLLRAAQVVVQEVPETRFVIVGEGPERPHLERLVAQLGLTDNVKLLGLRSDVRRILPAFDVLALTSTHVETLSLSVIEAMMAGKPVVATDVGSTRELVTDGQTGFLAPPRAYTYIAHRLLQVITDPAYARALGHAGRNVALRGYTERRMITEMTHVLESHRR